MTSVASACVVVSFLSRCRKFSLYESYQVEDASRGGLVLSALGQEQQTLTSLGSPGSGGVGNSGLLVLVEDVELLGLDGIVAEVQETLGEAQTPGSAR